MNAEDTQVQSASNQVIPMSNDSAHVSSAENETNNVVELPPGSQSLLSPSNLPQGTVSQLGFAAISVLTLFAVAWILREIRLLFLATRR